MEENLLWQHVSYLALVISEMSQYHLVTHILTFAYRNVYESILHPILSYDLNDLPLSSIDVQLK